MTAIIYKSQTKYLSKFRNSHDQLIKSMEEFAKKNNVPILDWHAAEFLEQIIRIKNPKRVLEIGTAIGYSTIRIAQNLRPGGIIETIEKSIPNIELAQKNIDESGLADKIKLIGGDALEILPSLKNKYDLIFLDADKEDYEQLFSNSMKLLKSDSVLFIDNLLWHGYTASSKVPEKYKASTKNIRKFNELFMNHINLNSTILPVGDGIGIGVVK
jgi:predicted O-methyltransferase YrrM